MVSCVRAVREAKTTETPSHSVGSASLLRRYKVMRKTESIEDRISKLEAQFGSYVQSVLRSQIGSEEIEVITTLSEASLKNIMTIQKLAKQIQEASNET